MIRRNKVFAAVMSCLMFTVTFGSFALISGCDDSPPPEAKVDKAKAQDVQDKMKEFMAKKASPASQKKH